MDKRIKIRDVFHVEATYKEFYTGGEIQITNDGKKMLCQCKGHITVVDIETVNVTQTIPDGLLEYDSFDEDEVIDDEILTFSLNNENSFLATAHKSGLIKLWKWPDGETFKTWKSAHRGPIAKLAFNFASSHLASGGCDSAIRVWDIDHHTCVRKLGGITGVTSILEYRIIDGNELLFASGDENVIRGWILKPNKEAQAFYKFSGHFSKITKILFSNDNSFLLSCGRDRVIMMWDLKTKKEVKALPVYESIETGFTLPENVLLPNTGESASEGLFIAVAGEKGTVRILNALNGKECFSYPEEITKTMKPILHVLYFNGCIFIINSEFNISIHELDEKFSFKKLMIGCHDEILDIALFGEKESNMAIASNTCDVHCYDENMNCTLLKGHTDIVLCLDSSLQFPNLLISGSKDNSVRVWMKKGDEITCVAAAQRHTCSVNDVALSCLSSQDPFMASASDDTTLKLWSLKGLQTSGVISILPVKQTVMAHDKSINCVCISPNNSLIATASQDKTAKIWSSQDLSLVSVFRGHKRGLWCAKFSPVDQLLLTSSADCTLRLWSLTSMTCMKTFEGLECSVLKCLFINHGLQIVGTGTDGLIKIWGINSGQVVASLNKHSTNVWALTVNEDNTKMISGGGDSRLIIWRDKTEEAKMEEIKKQQEEMEEEGELRNLINSNLLIPALKLAINHDKPGQTYNILQSLSANECKTKSLIEDLDEKEKSTLLKYACKWNANSKHCYLAQFIIASLLCEIASGDLNISTKDLEGFIAYTDKHFKRITKLLQDMQITEFTINQMQSHVT